MNRRFSLISAIAALLLFAGISETNAQIYSGQATGIRATVNTPLSPVLTTAIADSGPLSANGGTISHTSTAATLPSLLSAGDSTISTSGIAGVTQSSASVNTLNASAVSTAFTASSATSSATASCPAGTASGTSSVTGLVVNGTPIAITGDPNQIVPIMLLGDQIGTLTINEQITSPGSITVNALHYRVTDPLNLTETDIVVASSHAGIHCVSVPIVNRFGGRGIGVQYRQQSLNGNDTTDIISDTGFLPRQGSAPITVSTAGAGLPPLLSTGAVTASTSGGTLAGNLHQTNSSASVNNMGIDALGVVTIGANVLSSNTQCVCSLSVPSCTGSTGATGLTVTALGIPVPITITGNPNQTVALPLGLGSLIINEQQVTGTNSITVNALRVNLNVAGLAATGATFASSHSDIACAMPPLSAEVTVSGRVTDANGGAMTGVLVRLAGQTGDPRITLTNPFGYYSFSGVSLGETYFVEASKKGFSFSPRVIVPNDDIADLDFTPQGGGKGFR